MLLYIMEATNFRSEKQENPGNEEKTPNAVGKFAYRREDGIDVVSIGWSKDQALSLSVLLVWLILQIASSQRQVEARKCFQQ